MEPTQLLNAPRECTGASRPFLRTLQSWFSFCLYMIVVMPIPAVLGVIFLALWTALMLLMAVLLPLVQLTMNIIAACSGRFIAPYEHEPLPSGHDSIRLLKICPGMGSDLLRCELVDGRWSQSKYEALSYTWNCEFGFAEVSLINGQTFNLTPTLARALRALRDANDNRTVWIDAICINQRDSSEKSSQVQMMQKIYQHAQGVIVWLDVDSWARPASGSVEAAFEHVENLANGSDWNLDSIDITDRRWIETLNTIYCLDWWDRLWVIQEIASNPNVTVQCRTTSISWEHLCGFVMQESTARLLSLSDGRREFVQRIQALRAASAEDPQYGLLTFMHDFRYSMATEYRDRLYALRGLIKLPQNQTHLDVDYERSERSIEMEFTKECLHRYRSLNVLSLSDSKDRQWFDYKQATWCAIDLGNFTFSRSRRKAATLRHPLWLGAQDDKSLYNASGGTKARCRTDLPYDDMIGIQGFVLDIVEAVGDIFRIADSSAKQRQVLREWEELAGGTEPFELAVTAGAFATDPSFGCSWRADKAQRLDASRWDQLASVIELTSNFRRLITTKSNHSVGLGHSQTKPGDLICILLGSSVPYILRKSMHDRIGWSHPFGCWIMGCKRQKHMYCCVPEQYTLVGQAYINGSMQYEGDIERDIEDGNIKLKEFCLE